MEIHEVTIGGLSRSSQIELVPIGDIHLGVKNCDIKELKRVIKYVEKTPDCYWLGMGDYLECIKHTDKRFDSICIPKRYLEDLDIIVQVQLEDFIDLFKPILTPAQEGGKCLGIHRGNHENTVRRDHGEDVVRTLTKTYGLRDLWFKAITRMVFQRTGSSRSFDIHSMHGHGGGRKPGSNVNMMSELPKDISSSVHLMGHVHKLNFGHEVLLGCPQNVMTLKANEIIWAITGSFFRTYNENSTSYGEQAGYPPTVIGVPKITFSPWRERDKLHVEKLRT